MERITRENVEERVANVNRRMGERRAAVRYVAQGRNGYIGLDRLTPETEYLGEGTSWIIQATVTAGTKREVAEFLHAMMVALDDAKIYEDVSAAREP